MTNPEVFAAQKLTQARSGLRRFIALPSLLSGGPVRAAITVGATQAFHGNWYAERVRIEPRVVNQDVVLAHSFWWAGALWALGIMTAIILATLIWAVVVKRHVRERTDIMREWLRREAALK